MLTLMPLWSASLAATVASQFRLWGYFSVHNLTKIKKNECECLFFFQGKLKRQGTIARLELEKDKVDDRIDIIEETKEKMASKFSRGLIKFSKSGPAIVACKGNIKGTQVQQSIDDMYRFFKEADVIATKCNDHISKAVEVSTVLAKKIRGKCEKVEHEMRECEQQRNDAENEKERITDLVRDGERSVQTARRELQVAEEKRKREIREAEEQAEFNNIMAGIFTLGIGYGIGKAIQDPWIEEAKEELGRRVDEAVDDLVTRQRDLKNKEGELSEARDQIEAYAEKLELVRKSLVQIEDFDKKVRGNQKLITRLSTQIKKCLTVVRTTVGKSKMLRDECLSEIVTPPALVRIVHDLADYFKGQDLKVFLNERQNNSMMTAIKNIEKPTDCTESKTLLAASYDDFCDA